MLDKVVLKAGAQSGFVWFYLAVKKAGTVCKNRDKPINFIDAVSGCFNLILYEYELVKPL